MRTTWIILIVMIAVAAAMYFYFSKGGEPAAYDLISIVSTPDSVRSKLKFSEADQPLEIFYRDSAWSLEDSTRLPQILASGSSDSIDKSYRERTIFLTYDDRLYFDLDLRKADSAEAYKIDLEINSVADSIFVKGTIDQGKSGLISFRSPMANLYRSFVITYHDRLPDSIKNDTTRARLQSQATKVITVIEP
jgi:hypothetical protein